MSTSPSEDRDDLASEDSYQRRRPPRDISTAGVIGLLNGDTPWWARLLVIVLFYFGVPTLLVGVLLAMGAGWIPSPITDTHKLAADLKEQIEQTKKRDEKMTRFLGLICRNTAYTQVQQAECERIVQTDVR